jgi:replicative DNA helicase
MGPHEQHHIRNAVLCLKYLLGIGDIQGALEQVQRIDRAVKVIDLEEARWKRLEDERYSEALAFGWSVYQDLETIISDVPKPVVLKIMSLCRRALQEQED